MFEENYRRLRDELSSAGSSAKIVAVTKYLEPSDCARLRAAGYGPLGENRSDDLIRKSGDEPVRENWHFIGHLQRNKIPKVLPRISLLHSLDNEPLAAAMNRWLESQDSAPLDCLVQVNVAGEVSKGGLTVDAAEQCVPDWSTRYPLLRLCGLMTMAPHVAPAECRQVFGALRELRDNLSAALPAEMRARFTELSMGMSNDYRIAAEEGATLIRLGRILYERSG